MCAGGACVRVHRCTAFVTRRRGAAARRARPASRIGSGKTRRRRGVCARVQVHDGRGWLPVRGAPLANVDQDGPLPRPPSAFLSHPKQRSKAGPPAHDSAQGQGARRGRRTHHQSCCDRSASQMAAAQSGRPPYTICTRMHTGLANSVGAPPARRAAHDWTPGGDLVLACMTPRSARGGTPSHRRPAHAAASPPRKREAGGGGTSARGRARTCAMVHPMGW